MEKIKNLKHRILGLGAIAVLIVGVPMWQSATPAHAAVSGQVIWRDCVAIPAFCRSSQTETVTPTGVTSTSLLRICRQAKLTDLVWDACLHAIQKLAPEGNHWWGINKNPTPAPHTGTQERDYYPYVGACRTFQDGCTTTFNR